jgi:hypothetical protein
MSATHVTYCFSHILLQHDTAKMCYTAINALTCIIFDRHEKFKFIDLVAYCYVTTEIVSVFGADTYEKQEVHLPF